MIAVGVDALGVGVPVPAVMVKVTVTETGVPASDTGVMVTVVGYAPTAKPVGFAVKVSVEDVSAVVLPLIALTVSQEAVEEVSTVQVNVPPPVLLIVID